MLLRRNGVPASAHSRLFAAAVLLATALACDSGDTPPSAGGPPALRRVTPRVLGATGNDPGAWALFDRDTASGWTLPANLRTLDVTAFIDRSAELRALKVYGPSPYRLSVLDPQGAPVSGPFELAELPEGWNTFPLPVERQARPLILRFESTGPARSPVAEVELWGTDQSLPLEWEPVPLPGADTPPPALADVIPATSGTQRLSQVSAPGLSSCAAFTFELPRPPSVYRRTWLRYSTEGVFRPLVLTRVLNDGAMTRGFWVPATSSGAMPFIQPIDSEDLKVGHNKIDVCLPGEANSEVKISDMELVAELDHGSNIVEAISLAPFDGIPTLSALSLLRDAGDVVTVDASQELVVAFERWISPDAVQIAAQAGTSWSLRCVDAAGAAHALPASLAATEASTSVYAIGDATHARCAGLRLRPSGPASVTHLRVFGSGTDRRVDFPRIVLASAREHFGSEAWVDGWARAPSRVGGGVLVTIDGQRSESTSGVFASMLQRATDPSKAWPVTITARFADGSTTSRQFVLDRSAGQMPGAETRDPTLNDGLTPEERRERFGDVGQIAEADISPGQATRLALGTHVSVDVPADALSARKHFSIKHLDTGQLPRLDPGLINVTAPFRHAYEFQPHGAVFNNALKISLPYQPSLIPQGYVPEDIETFYYDDAHKRWEPLARAVVVRGRQVVESLTDHFTIMINAIVVSPEHPQAASFDPNRIKGIKAGTPAAGMRLVEKPEVNSRGDAALNYPLEVPPGRLGVQPSFALSYSSARGPGWMGVGWDIGASAIEVDSRMGGVPRYEPTLESETYLLDGSQLAPTARRDPFVPRSAGTARLGGEDVKLFHPRVEGAFQRIVRHGDGPTRYWWEVTDRQGKRFFYGGTPETGRQPGACLTDDAGNVFRWALREMRDTHGNRVRFDYDTVTWSAPGHVSGRELYLASAHYTLRVGETTAPYRVVFLREPPCTNEGQTNCRKDLIVSGRGGFKQVNGERLHRIEVYFRQTLVRAWELEYSEGPFGKSLLRRFKQFGVNNEPFVGNEHSFDYFDDVTGDAASQYGGFAVPETWSTGDEEPDSRSRVGATNATVLGGSRGRAKGWHLYLGVAFGEEKQISVGAKVGGRLSYSDGVVALVDIDGDNLPDRVFRGTDGRFYYNRNESGPVGPPRFAAQAAPIAGLPAISHERSSLHSIGPEAYVVPLSFHWNKGFGHSEQDTYFADVNSDGYVDLVRGSTVYFSRPGAGGRPVFVANDSSGTPVPIGVGAVTPDVLPPSFEDPEFAAHRDDYTPPVDTVRSWRAPYAGRVHVTGAVRLAQVQRAGADGLKASIEHAGNTLWIFTFAPGEVDPQQPDLEVDVAAGDPLYFRIQTLRDAHDDRVRWSPIIEYVDQDPAQDENNLPVHRFNAADDFVLAQRTGAGFHAPFTGTLRVTGTLKKLRETSDDIQVSLTVNDTTAFTHVIPAASPATVALDELVSVTAGSLVTLRIHTDSPIDLTALAFEPADVGLGAPGEGPWLRYVSAVDKEGRPLPIEDDSGKPLFTMPLPYDMTAYGRLDPAEPPTAYVPPSNQTVHVTATVRAGTTPHKGTVTFTAKSQGHLLGKKQVVITNGGSHTMTLDVPVTANQPTFFAFSVSNPDLYEVIQTSATSSSGPLPTMRYGVARSSRLSQPYRGWSFGGYNGGGSRGELPIQAEELDAPSIFGPDDHLTKDNAEEMANRFAQEDLKGFVFLPAPDTEPCRFAPDDPRECPPIRGAHWRGPDEFSYVTATEMSTSRLGGPGMVLTTPAQVAGGHTVPRISRNSNTALGFGAGYFGLSASGSFSDGHSNAQLDYMDMAGDGFPDVVTTQAVQYTSPLGVLAESRSVLSGFRETRSDSISVGVGGNPAEARSGGARSKPQGGQAHWQMTSTGVNLGAGGSGGSQDSEGDLMDVNGDGLPDRVRQEGATLMVRLNLGYKFAPWEPWGSALIHRGNSREKNASVSSGLSLARGMNDGAYGFSAGLSGAESKSGTDELDFIGIHRERGATLLDLNGDGLLDQVKLDGDGLAVRFNLGGGISSRTIHWFPRIGSDDISANKSTSLSGGLYFTIALPIIPKVLSFLINPGVDFDDSIEGSNAIVRDIDGDGYPDHLISNNSHQVSVARNRTGRTNLLRHVKRPLGAEMWLDYTRAGNTQDMPESRWVLSEVKVYDGQADSAELGQATDYTLERIRYVDGRHDRYEREFYGFAHVEVDTVDTRGWDGVSPSSALPVYRRQELDFINTDYYRHGLLAATRTRDGSGAVFERSSYVYQLRDIATGRVLTPAEAKLMETVFPAQVEEHHYRHEGNPDAFIHTFTTQDYDLDGNVTHLYDSGGPGPNDDYQADIRYTGLLSTCRAYHIVGVADRIVVRDAAGAVLRRREASIDCASGTGDLRQIRVSLDGTAVATTDLTYDSDGNLTSVTDPPNHRGQRYQLRYTHDPEVQTHVVRIDDSFNSYSAADYDLRYGAPTAEVDINGNSVLTEYDGFGRVARVRGPYEIARGLDYAIRFAYRPEAPVPFATTAHMDAFRNVADPIETVTFVDGLARAIQVKKDATLHRGDDIPAEDAVIVSGRIHFDPWGRQIAQWHPTEEPKSTSLNLVFRRPVDTSAPPTRTTYDVLDRQTEIVYPDAARTQQLYSLAPALADGGLWELTITIDAENKRRDNYRDARENIRAVVEYLSGRAITTHYEYDPLKQIRRVIDAKNNLTHSEYDLAGRRTDVTHPDSGHTQMVYDAAGNVVRRITANLRLEGGAIEYLYEFTHLVQIRYPRFTDNNVTYAWGEAGLRGQGGNRVGRIVRVDDNSGFEERRYGALGEVVYERRSIDSHTMGNSTNSPEIYETQYLYDTWGRLQQMIYPDTEVLTYSYDSGGQVRRAAGVKLGVRFPYVSRLEYDRFEQREFLQTGNGIRSHYTYDPRNRRLARLEAGEFQNLTYGYDKVGNILGLVNDVPTARPNEYGGRVEQHFTYDDLYRLVDANGTWFQPPEKQNQYTYSMQYDDIHNIMSKNQRHWIRNRTGGKDIIQHKTTYDWGYAYGSGKPHAATHMGDRTFFYDANGNQTGWDDDRSGRRRTIVWDEENRIQSISDNGRTTRFVYDDGGNRIIKTGAQGETVYVNENWTVRNRSVGAKHIYVGTMRIASKLSPGDAHVRPDAHDLTSVMLGNWWEHRSESGFVSGRNTETNPHYQVPSELPDDGMPDTNFLYFYHPNHIRSTSYVTDVDGSLYEHMQYFPSGETWVDQRSNTERLPHLFSGKELDQETDLYYFGARYYDSRMTLWASTDPAITEYLDGENSAKIYKSENLSAYSYASNEPLNHIDPDGRTSIYNYSGNLVVYKPEEGRYIGWFRGKLGGIAIDGVMTERGMVKVPNGCFAMVNPDRSLVATFRPFNFYGASGMSLNLIENKNDIDMQTGYLRMSFFDNHPEWATHPLAVEQHGIELQREGREMYMLGQKLRARESTGSRLLDSLRDAVGNAAQSFGSALQIDGLKIEKIGASAYDSTLRRDGIQGVDRQ